MEASALRNRITKRLLTEIEDVQYPSVTMLNRAEARLASPEALANYTEILVEKVEATRFSSAELLTRLDGLLARLERAERAASR